MRLKNCSTFALASVAALSLPVAAFGQQAVQWRVQDGGNGHWYALNLSSMDWSVARDFAAQRGGHLATIASSAENGFIYQFILEDGIYQDYWLGGYRSSGFCSPPCLQWITGEAWTYETWVVGDSWGCPAQNPNFCGWNGPGTGYALEMNARPDTGGGGKWNDESPTLYYEGAIVGAPSVIEWSADCNEDGVVDYGQILNGTYEDLNTNGVPDCCEGWGSCQNCVGDVTGNGIVDGLDLAAVLAAWGTSGKGEFPTDRNDDGTVNAQDLSLVLAGWGPCP